MLRVDGAQSLAGTADFREIIRVIAQENNKTQNMSTVRCFLFLLYDEGHPYLRKVLSDKAFWGALDKKTGSRLAVIAYREKEYVSPPAPMRLMLDAGDAFSEDVEELNSKLMDDVFGIKVPREQLPLFIVFSPDHKGCDPVTIAAIRFKDVDDTYQKLDKLIGGLGKKLSEYSEKDLKNTRETMLTARGFLEDRTLGIRMRNFIEDASWIKEFASFLWK